MKNWEKYEEELKDVGLSFAVTRSGIERCADVRCHDCVLGHMGGGNCDIDRLNWLYKDYIAPKPKLTIKERAIVESIISMAYIARDEDGTLCIYNSKVGKDETSWYSEGKAMVIDAELFPFITWESGRFWSIKELKELEVEE